MILLWLLTAPVWGQRQAILFDGAAQSASGLTLDFSRAAPAYLPTGELVGPDVPRYLPETLFCAPAAADQLETGLSINILGAGDAGDGRPVYIINTATNQRLTIHIGEGSVEQAFVRNNWSGVYQLIYKDFSKDGQANLLKGQQDANGGTADQPGLAFGLTGGGAVHNGLIIVACEVFEPSADDWASRRVALAYTTVTRLGSANPWIIAALGPATNVADTNRGASWSISSFVVSDDELIVTWTDYRGPAKSGGQAYGTRFTRSDGTWSSETILLASGDTPKDVEHWHCAGLIQHDDGRASVLISTGDGAADNSLFATTRTAGGQWASTTPVADTAIHGEATMFEPSADWTEPVIVWGGQSTFPKLRHNQVISMTAADPNNRRLLCGGDETKAPVLALSYDPDNLLPSWETLYLPAVTSWPLDGVLNFSMQGHPGGPYFGRIDASSAAQWQAQQRETRLLFSPDGQHWGQCLVVGTPGERQSILWEDHAYLGSQADETAGFRHIALPEWKLIRPLAISPSTDNLQRAMVPAPNDDVNSQVVIARINGVDDLPAGVPPPPCDPRSMFLIDNRSTGGHLGAWKPASDVQDVPSPRRSVLLRAWVYALAPEPGQNHPQTTAQLSLRFDNAKGDQLTVWSGRAEFDAGKWMPITMWCPWVPLDSTEVPERPWLPLVRLRAETASTVYAEFRMLIAWEGLYLDPPTVQGFGLPPQTAGAGEDATINGLSLGDEWTMLLVGMVPEDQWDNRVGGTLGSGVRTKSPHLPQLFELDDLDGGTVRVLADPPLEGYRLASTIRQTDRETNSVRSTYWLRGSPVLCVLRSDGQSTNLSISIGGGTPRQLELHGAISPQRIRLGPDPMWWYGVDAIPHFLSADKLPKVFHTMQLWCPTDFNQDGVVDSRDMIAFLNAWSLKQPNADYNGDGVHDTRDVLNFLADYTNGC